MAQAQALTPGEPDPIDESRMTLMEHLNDLRMALMWIGAALIVGTAISLFFAEDILVFLSGPVDAVEERLIAITPMEKIIIFFKIAFTAGTIAALPVIVYQIIAFVAPGLYPHEKRIVYSTLPGVMILFIIGASFAFWIMIPLAVDFLAGFLDDAIETEWTVESYYALVIRLVFWIGVSFEMPLVITILARIGLVSGPALLRFWRHAIVTIAVLAAFITPTVDPVNMAIVMAPLIVLYFLSVGMAYLVFKPREPRDFND
ncbi:MAG: twin-arginine translocase subunit TatC [Chloroflexota bacterium]